MNTPASETPKISSELLEYRKVLVAADQKGQEEFDKAVLSLSGGGLAVSLVFLKDVIGDGEIKWPYLLMTAWGVWAVSTLAVLLSYHLSNLTIRRGIQQIDDGQAYTGPFGGGFAKATAWLNGIGAVLFFVGVIAITVFACINLPTAKETTKNGKQAATAASAASAPASATSAASPRK